MYKVTMSKKVFLPNHNNLIDIDVEEGVHSIPAESIYEEGKRMLVDQYTFRVKYAINAYEKSAIPDKYLEGQHFIVSNKKYGFHSVFCLDNDDIIFDPNSLIGARNHNAPAMLGHEIGHKIEKYKDDAIMDETYDDIATMLQMSNAHKPILSEIFAYAVGNIVTGSNQYFTDYRLPDSMNERIKSRVLATIYKI